MAHITQHERDCQSRWEIQRRTMEDLKNTALSNFTSAAAERAAFREQIGELRLTLRFFTGVIGRVAAWVVPAMAAGLCGAVWWIVTHPSGH